MKKSLLFVGLTLMLVVSSVYAGTQYNWGTSTGANWITPDNTAIVPGQPVIVGSTTTYPTVITSTAAALSLGAQTITQINAMTPLFFGQIVGCSNCTATPICVSTGTGTGAFTAVASTAASGAVPIHCQ